MSKPANSVLVIDDEPQIRRFVGAGLELHGYTVKEANTGAAGLSAAAHMQPDVIVLDLGLPDMGGIEILQRVKENKHLKSTPVVVLTTTDDSQEIKRCYELGCNVYITKPVNYESFANAIRQLGLFFSVIQVPPAAT